MYGARILADRSQIGCRLTVKQTQFLQIVPRECFESLAVCQIQKLLQFAPVRLPFLQPACCDHRCDSMDELKIDTPEQIALELPLAGIGSRFLALGIDTLLQFIIYFIGMIVFALVTVGSYGFSWIPKSMGIAFFVILVFCVYWGYFALYDAFWNGQTPGKKY